MPYRKLRAAPPSPTVVFDDRVHSHSIGTLATAFCIGGALTPAGAHDRPRGAHRARGRPGRRRTADARAAPGGGAGRPQALCRPLVRAGSPAQPIPETMRRPGHGRIHAAGRRHRGGSQPLRAGRRPYRRSARRSARVAPVAGQPGAGRLEVRFAPAWLALAARGLGRLLDPEARPRLPGGAGRHARIASTCGCCRARRGSTTPRCRPSWTTRARWASTSTRSSALARRPPAAPARRSGFRSGWPASRSRARPPRWPASRR